MGSKSFLSRFFFVALPILLITTFVTSANAQGLFGVGLPGLPPMGGLLGRTATCGERLFPYFTEPVFYVGWMENSQGTAFTVDPDDVAFNSIQHNYPTRGLWLGLTESIRTGDWLSFMASGWLLVPSTVNSRETYPPSPFGVTWDVDPQWGYVDGIFAGSPCSGLNLLAGLRYDYYTARFKNPFEPIVFVGSNDGDIADVTSQSWIFLLGTQCSYAGSWGNLVVRAVGFPALLGNVNYSQTLFTGERLQAKGNWKNGYFLEFFGEYSKRFGLGTVGLFGRWNLIHGQSDVTFEDLVPPPFPSIVNTRNLTLNRSAWTLGGSFSLDFNLPM